MVAITWQRARHEEWPLTSSGRLHAGSAGQERTILSKIFSLQTRVDSGWRYQISTKALQSADAFLLKDPSCHPTATLWRFVLLYHFDGKPKALAGRADEKRQKMLGRPWLRWLSCSSRTGLRSLYDSFDLVGGNRSF